MRWYLEQICRIYRMPLPLVQDWTHGTYTNSEQAGLWFAQHTITPICVDTERVARKLFMPGEDQHYVKFNVDGTLRGDYTTRTQGYSVLINAGVMSPNEARAYEDMDPYDGGDEYRLPLNTAPVGEPSAQTDTELEAQAATEPTDPAMEPGDTPEPRAILQPMIDDTIERIRIRYAQDQERGRDEGITREWAHEVAMRALIKAHQIAGLELDQDAETAIVDEAICPSSP
jgi:hypothetical protein